MRYGDKVDMREVADTSQRLTAPLCVAGGIALQLLREKGIEIHGHLKQVGSDPRYSYRYGSSRYESTLKSLQNLSLWSMQTNVRSENLDHETQKGRRLYRWYR